MPNTPKWLEKANPFIGLQRQTKDGHCVAWAFGQDLVHRFNGSDDKKTPDLSLLVILSLGVFGLSA